MCRGSSQRFPDHLRDAINPLLGDNKGRSLAILATGWFFILGTQFAIPALLPQIKADLDIDNAAAGMALSVMWLLHGLMQFPAGVLSDWVGERRLILSSLFLTGFSLVLYSVTSGFPSFLVATGLFGAGSGLYGTPLFSLLSKVYDDRNATVFGLTSASGNIGAGILPVLTTPLSVIAGWRFGFGVLVPFIAGVILSVWYFMYRPSEAESIHFPGPSWATLECVWTALLQRGVIILVAGFILMTFIYQGFTAFLPTYLATSKQLPQATAGALYGMVFLVGAVSQPSAGYLADRIGTWTTLGIITGVTALVLASVPVVSGLIPLAALVPLLGVQMAVGPVCSAHMLTILPADIQGIAYGLLRTVWFGLGSTAPFVVGSLADNGQFDLAFFLFAAIAGTAVVLFIGFPAGTTSATS